MPHRVIFSPEAEAQLVRLHRDIAERSSPVIGEQYTRSIAKYCLGLSIFPHRGTRREDLGQVCERLDFANV